MVDTDYNRMSPILNGRTMSELAGRTAIVTGGAVRIGRALVEGLARRGARVLVHFGGSQDAAEALVGNLRGERCDVACVQADLAEPVAATETVFAAVQDKFGAADILINSAGIFEKGSLSDTTELNWDRHLAINLKSPFFLSQAFARQLPAGRAGNIINVIDWRGTHPVPGHAAYTVAKAGLAALTQLLAQEVGSRIRVNGISPGAILPPPGFDQATFEKLADGIPVGRVGNVGHIVDAARFLLCNDFLNGEILHVTGGQELMVGHQD
jgi:pteridine reductase